MAGLSLKSETLTGLSGAEWAIANSARCAGSCAPEWGQEWGPRHHTCCWRRGQAGCGEKVTTVDSTGKRLRTRLRVERSEELAFTLYPSKSVSL